MAQMEYAYKVPAEFKPQLSVVRAALKGSSAGEGMIRRYLAACEFDAPRAIVELLMHDGAPLDACSCVVCAGGQRRSFKMSGELLSVTPLEWQKHERGQITCAPDLIQHGQRRRHHTVINTSLGR